MLALTATATGRVRTDIIAHLKLREPATYVASFNRPNLTYRVTPKDQPLKQVIDFVRRREHESGIIYCATRATTERVADALAGRGFSAPELTGMLRAVGLTVTRSDGLFLSPGWALPGASTGSGLMICSAALCRVTSPNPGSGD